MCEKHTNVGLPMSLWHIFIRQANMLGVCISHYKRDKYFQIDKLMIGDAFEEETFSKVVKDSLYY